MLLWWNVILLQCYHVAILSCCNVIMFQGYYVAMLLMGGKTRWEFEKHDVYRQNSLWLICLLSNMLFIWSKSVILPPVPSIWKISVLRAFWLDFDENIRNTNFANIQVEITTSCPHWNNEWRLSFEQYDQSLFKTGFTFSKVLFGQILLY